MEGCQRVGRNIVSGPMIRPSVIASALAENRDLPSRPML
ncbi:hypothetical protein BIWAKO_00307 [Bosea sp. BIWAKO-01]|nr:hypothetical protein BIWAKO_00307 [Bosea sp. BIWAKO-01]